MTALTLDQFGAFRASLGSDGTHACELDNLHVTGER